MFPLNTEQRLAAEYRDGPMLLLAGAGSGKTRVITERINMWIDEGVPANQILAVTFTNRAAKEMAERLTNPSDPRLSKPLVSTFHALGARLLRQHAEHFGRSPRFVIYDADDQKALVKRLFGADGPAPSSADVSQWIHEISTAKAARTLGQFETDPKLARYEAELRASDAFDFDDLIAKPVTLFREDAHVRSSYRRRWRFVCVDEFQDTNEVQYAWVKELCPPGSQLLVVGDDDQSIYGWRGAEVGNILSFDKDYPNARTIRLERNYRSTQSILSIANTVIANNHDRLGKELWSERDDDSSVVIQSFEQQSDESAYVARECRRLQSAGQFSWNDIAILVRANHLSFDFEKALRAESIPYRVVRGRSFYDRAEIKDALSVLRLGVNPNDTNSLLRTIRQRVQGVGKKTIERLQLSSVANERSLWATICDPSTLSQLKGRGKNSLMEFSEQLKAFIELESAELDVQLGVYRELLESLGILEINSLYVRDEKLRQRNENVMRFLAELSEWATTHAEGTLDEYLEQTALVADADGLTNDEPGVSIMTVHAAKGLEFPLVFVVALEEGVFPHSRATSSGDVEEERRLFYVAVTRAMDRVVLTRSRVRRVFADVTYQRKSRFLVEIGKDEVHELEPSQPLGHSSTWFEPTPELNFVVGQSVWHGQFGAGTVKSVSHGRSEIVAVNFPGIGTRKILADFLSAYEASGDGGWS